MTTSWSSSTYNEFALEALRVEEMVWAAVAVEPETEIVFCGYENSRKLIDRAVEIGAKVAVIDSNSDGLRAASERGLETIRASTTNIPIRNDRFQLAIAHHYLHEVDPTYHTQIIFELGRIARRIAIVEPGPPADLLGGRIASLYSRAKRRLGQFEQYQPLEYWRRLLLGVRAHVNPAEIRFAHLPPKEFLHETIEMVLDSVKMAGAPEDDLKALRGVASASDAQLVPQPRYVLLAGVSSTDIPDRPRFHELQKQAPERQTVRFKKRKPEPERPEQFADPASPPIEFHTAGIAETIKPRRRRGFASWFQAPDLHVPMPLALPGQTPAQRAEQDTPVMPPIGDEHQPPNRFVRPQRASETASTEPAPGFGFAGGHDKELKDNPLQAMFGVPQMPGTDSMDWNDGDDRFGF